MGLFDRYHLSPQEAANRLKRPLAGDPSEGEWAVLYALNKDQVDDARSRLQHDPRVGPDFRQMVEKHVQEAGGRARENKLWNVRIPRAAFDHYAAEARRGRVSVQTCLEEAVLRDYEQVVQGENLVRALDTHVRDYHTATGHVLEEVKAIARAVGSLSDIAMRLSRLEGVIGRLVAR